MKTSEFEQIVKSHYPHLILGGFNMNNHERLRQFIYSAFLDNLQGPEIDTLRRFARRADSLQEYFEKDNI